VFVPVAASADYRLAFSSLPFSFPSSPAQTVTVNVNGQFRLPQVNLSSGTWQTYVLDVPAGTLKPGLNELDFEFAYARAPRDVMASDDARTLSAAFDWLRWDVK
jgi:hypothetical protein